MANFIYCDNAATTCTRQEVIETMVPVFAEDYGNASSLHKAGRKAKQLLDQARKQVATLLNCTPDEVFFTSGGTESNNIAIYGSIQSGKKNNPTKNHLITSVIEHSAVYQPMKRLEGEGYEVTWLKVDNEGFVNLDELKASIKPNTLLVSIMHANNEVGTIQDIDSIGKLCRDHNVIFHTDAVQSAGKVPIDVKKSNIDLLSISGHKIYGPKGIGILFIRQRVLIEPLLFGGTQECGLKPGTENLPGIVGIGKAIELRTQELEAEAIRLNAMQQKLIDELLQIDGTHLNGPKDLNKRVPGNVNISLQDIEGDTMVLHMDLKGLCISSGSACAEGSIEPSRVIAAIYPDCISYAFNSIRISLGLHNKEEEIPQIIETVTSIVQKLRDSKKKLI
jgi:cysteine desulfurase